MSQAAYHPASGFILAIEVSNPSAWTAQSPCRPGVVIAQPVGNTMKVLARGDTHPEHAHSDGLILAIADAMNQAGLTPRQIGTIAVSAGPGGYTAVRLAITTAKMIAEVNGAACIPVPTADCVAHSALTNGASKPLAVALASKGDSCFLTEFDDDATSPGHLITITQWNPTTIRTLIADSFLPVSFAAKAANQGVQRILPIFDALACAAICHRYAAVDPLRLAPIYPREPEAVTKWRALRDKA